MLYFVYNRGFLFSIEKTYPHDLDFPRSAFSIKNTFPSLKAARDTATAANKFSEKTRYMAVDEGEGYYHVIER